MGNDEINEVKTCLDEALRKPELTNADLARAMRGFIVQCYGPHLRITQGNAKKIDEIIEAVHPISEWAKPRIEAEKRWIESKRKVVLHVVCWSIPIALVWLLSVFGDGFRAWLRAFLAG